MVEFLCLPESIRPAVPLAAVHSIATRNTRLRSLLQQTDFRIQLIIQIWLEGFVSQLFGRREGEKSSAIVASIGIGIEELLLPRNQPSSISGH